MERWDYEDETGFGAQGMRLSAPQTSPRLFEEVRAIYFDLDDTLCAYWDACKAGLRAAFEGQCPQGISPDAMVRSWAASFRRFGPTLKKTEWYPTYLQHGGPTRTEQMRLALLEAGIEDDAVAERLGDAYGRTRNEALALFDEVRGVLELLAPRYPLGVITNGPADIQREEIATLGLGPLIQHVFIEGEMGEGKPLPAVFERARQAVDLPPHRILFVGNSYKNDIQPAIAAGWRTAWVRRASDVPPSASGEAPKPEEKPEGAPDPDLTIHDLTELLAPLGVR